MKRLWFSKNTFALCVLIWVRTVYEIMGFQVAAAEMIQASGEEMALISIVIMGGGRRVMSMSMKSRKLTYGKKDMIWLGTDGCCEVKREP